MAKTEKLKRQLTEIRAEFSEAIEAPPVLRVVFELHDVDGVTGYADVTGQPVEPTADDVILTMRADMLPGLTSGEDVVVLHGGRDSAKSGSTARYIVGRMIARRERALAVRDSRQSQIESMQRLMVDIIEADPRLFKFFDDITRDRIGAINGSNLTFLGLREYRSSAVRSYQGVTLVWCEEAQTLDRAVWDVLEPTIRERGSQIICTLNPDKQTDVIYKTFITHERPDSYVGQFLYTGNPWLSEKTKRLSETMKTTDPAQYQHVYGGGIRMYSEARILDRVTVIDFDIEDILSRRRKMEIKDNWRGSIHERRAATSRMAQSIEENWYIGLDFGASQAHPAALVECYLDDGPGQAIYVTRECEKVATDPDVLLSMCKAVPRIAEGWPVRCDDSRPDLIAYLKKHGVKAIAAGKGIVVDEIDVLREFEIFIHSTCENAAREIIGWSYKTDRGGEIVPVPEKINDHCPDALRYGVVKAARGDQGGYYKMPVNW